MLVSNQYSSQMDSSHMFIIFLLIVRIRNPPKEEKIPSYRDISMNFYQIIHIHRNLYNSYQKIGFRLVHVFRKLFESFDFSNIRTLLEIFDFEHRQNLRFWRRFRKLYTKISHKKQRIIIWTCCEKLVVIGKDLKFI